MKESGYEGRRRRSKLRRKRRKEGSRKRREKGEREVKESTYEGSRGHESKLRRKHQLVCRQ